MFETVHRSLSVLVYPHELSPDIEDIIQKKIKDLEGKHFRDDYTIITKMKSIHSLSNTFIDPDTGVCEFLVHVTCEQYRLSPHEHLSLCVSRQNKMGVYFDYGPFELFLSTEIVPFSTSVIGTQMCVEVDSIRFSDVTHRYIVVVHPNTDGEEEDKH